MRLALCIIGVLAWEISIVYTTLAEPRFFFTTIVLLTPAVYVGIKRWLRSLS